MRVSCLPGSHLTLLPLHPAAPAPILTTLPAHASAHMSRQAFSTRRGPRPIARAQPTAEKVRRPACGVQGGRHAAHCAAVLCPCQPLCQPPCPRQHASHAAHCPPVCACDLSLLCCTRFQSPTPAVTRSQPLGTSQARGGGRTSAGRAPQALAPPAPPISLRQCSSSRCGLGAAQLCRGLQWVGGVQSGCKPASPLAMHATHCSPPAPPSTCCPVQAAAQRAKQRKPAPAPAPVEKASLCCRWEAASARPMCAL